MLPTVADGGLDPSVWILSIAGALTVALSGILPLIVIPIDNVGKLSEGIGAARLQCLLSFAVGSLLGDVFLHLLPEAWASLSAAPSETSTGLVEPSVSCGAFVIIGILSFTLVEKAFSHRTTEVTGYLNLVANCVDNFTHGLAVAGSFVVSTRCGLMTTFAILLHEVPHEMGDFAILLRSGFDRWRAARAQMMTGCGGLLGAVTALWLESSEVVGSAARWILPFTAGGFINIALANVLPEILQEKKPKEALRQAMALCLGVSIMYIVSV